MLLFDKGYSYIKQRYIVPLSTQRVQYKSLKRTNIKTILSDGLFTTATPKEQGKRCVLEFDEDILIPALLGDMWLCYVRACLQRDATTKMYSPDYCPIWSIVSDYYYAFFAASTLLRLTMRGTIYFDADVKRAFSAAVNAVSGEEYTVAENSIYVIQKDTDSTRNGIYKMELKPASGQTHETVWKEAAMVMDELRRNATEKSEERVALDCIKTVLTAMKPNFPSMLRNAVNYQLPYGIKAVEREIYPAQALRDSEKWFEPILTFESSKKHDDAERVQLFRAYTKYLDVLVHNLIGEYYDLQGRKNGIESAINKNRAVPLEFPGITYTY